jgi:hypothetical protein
LNLWSLGRLAPFPLPKPSCQFSSESLCARLQGTIQQ